MGAGTRRYLPGEIGHLLCPGLSTNSCLRSFLVEEPNLGAERPSLSRDPQLLGATFIYLLSLRAAGNGN